MHRFSVLDERWDDGLRRLLDTQGEEGRQRVARPRQRVETVLELPQDLVGSHRITSAPDKRGGHPRGQGSIGDRRGPVTHADQKIHPEVRDMPAELAV